jgi:hypothetical protein
MTEQMGPSVVDPKAKLKPVSGKFEHKDILSA